ncbi:MAG: heme-binding protein [Ferruginibacter sp.]|nr:heme-binding protein [Ferruginibacter sp.]
MNITLAQAEAAISAAKKKAIKLKTKMNICVVDAGSNLIAFAHMDGGWIGSVDISMKKAKTAAWFLMDTAALSPLVQPGEALFNIEHSNGGLITFPGGVVIKDEAGEVIGAIGVSGSTVDNDHAVAIAGMEAIK